MSSFYVFNNFLTSIVTNAICPEITCLVQVSEAMICNQQHLLAKNIKIAEGSTIDIQKKSDTDTQVGVREHV